MPTKEYDDAITARRSIFIGRRGTRFLGEKFNLIKAFVSNLFWKLDVEDNAFVILRNNSNGIVASLHSTMTQWRHLFSFEVFLEKGYMVLMD